MTVRTLSSWTDGPVDERMSESAGTATVSHDPNNKLEVGWFRNDIYYITAGSQRVLVECRQKAKNPNYPFCDSVSCLNPGFTDIVSSCARAGGAPRTPAAKYGTSSTITTCILVHAVAAVSSPHLSVSLQAPNHTATDQTCSAGSSKSSKTTISAQQQQQRANDGDRRQRRRQQQHGYEPQPPHRDYEQQQ